MTGSGLELIALTKLYGSTVAVDRLDLKVSANSYCCLLGPSGCGKTSTLRLVAGHEVASSGDIIIGGRNVPHFPPPGSGTSLMFPSFFLFSPFTSPFYPPFPLKNPPLPQPLRRAPPPPI